jgi:hypothetical protein
MQPDPALLREALLRLRDPLARVALSFGASELAPRARDSSHAAEVERSALAEADERIEELLCALARSGAAPLAREPDCRAAFAEACARAAAAARARAIRLDSAATNAPLPGAAREVRLATLRLLRVAFAWAGRDACVCIELAGVERAALLCQAERAGACAQAAALRDRLVRFALVSGANLAGLDSLASQRLSLRVELP